MFWVEFRGFRVLRFKGLKSGIQDLDFGVTSEGQERRGGVGFSSSTHHTFSRGFGIGVRGLGFGILGLGFRV